MRTKGRTQSSNVVTDSSVTGKGSYDANGNRISNSLFQKGPLTRNGEVYDSNYDRFKGKFNRLNEFEGKFDRFNREEPDPEDKKCFAAGTMITMDDGSQRPIESISSGDLIASFDETADGGRGALVPKRVVRTFVNENQIVIDFHGTKVTPGHAYLCGDGPHQGRFRQIMNIIRDDGAVVRADGSLMRAATGCSIGSTGDALIEIQIARPARNKLTGEPVTLLKGRGRIRAGTRLQRPDGSFFSFLELIETNGWILQDDGLVRQGPDHPPEPLFWAGATIPRPEDYVLALSQLTLADLYDDPQQIEMPQGGARARQGEENAVVLQAAAFSDGQEGQEAANPSAKRRIRDFIDTARGKRRRAPRHAGEIVH